MFTQSQQKTLLQIQELMLSGLYRLVGLPLKREPKSH